MSEGTVRGVTLTRPRRAAKANGHPEWKGDVQAVFARTWIDKAERGWWYRKVGGRWAQK